MDAYEELHSCFTIIHECSSGAVGDILLCRSLYCNKKHIGDYFYNITARRLVDTPNIKDIINLNNPNKND